MYDISVLRQSLVLPGIITVAGIVWLGILLYHFFTKQSERKGVLTVLLVILAMVVMAALGVAQQIRFIKNPNVREATMTYSSARTGTFDFGDVYVFSDEYGHEYELTVYPKISQKYLDGRAPTHGKAYLLYYEPDSMTVLGIYPQDEDAQSTAPQVVRNPISIDEFKEESHYYSLGKIYREAFFSFLVLLIIAGVGLLIVLLASHVSSKVFAGLLTLFLLFWTGPDLVQNVRDAFSPDIVSEEMFFEDHNYNGGNGALFFTTLEYDFSSDDGNQLSLETREGKLENYH